VTEAALTQRSGLSNEGEYLAHLCHLNDGVLASGCRVICRIPDYRGPPSDDLRRAAARDRPAYVAGLVPAAADLAAASLAAVQGPAASASSAAVRGPAASVSSAGARGPAAFASSDAGSGPEVAVSEAHAPGTAASAKIAAGSGLASEPLGHACLASAGP